VEIEALLIHLRTLLLFLAAAAAAAATLAIQCNNGVWHVKNVAVLEKAAYKAGKAGKTPPSCLPCCATASVTTISLSNYHEARALARSKEDM
jgi:hypothetical protein